MEPRVERCGPRVALDLDGASTLLLTPLQVGRLRAELRDAVVIASMQHAAQTEPTDAARRTERATA